LSVLSCYLLLDFPLDEIGAAYSFFSSTDACSIFFSSSAFSAFFSSASGIGAVSLISYW
jgi:hypothetical protein